MNMKNQYRIVPDCWAGYEVQIKRWWFPFWFQCWRPGFSSNTFFTLQRAEAFIAEHANPKQRKVYTP